VKVIKFLVEGKTELAFFNQLLYPHLLSLKISSYAISLDGVRSYRLVKKNLRKLLDESHNDTITTMIDFYHLPDDFPGYSTMPTSDCYAKVDHLEQEWENDIEQDNFIPYLQLHEFEALLFSSIADIQRTFHDQNKLKNLQNILDQFSNPEKINEGNNTSPAKRLKSLFANYRKPFHGGIISNRIGLQKMRDNCSHFNNWITNLESLGTH